MLDVIIVGGGPAGLSAALVLGRCRRSVLLVDSGEYRNAVSRESHGFLSRDCEDPAEIRSIGREQLRRYGTVEVREALVDHASRRDDGSFEVEFNGGEQLTPRKLLLATGLVDELPPLEGFEAIYGITAWHCPYCDGWERRDQALAVYGKGQKGKALALEMLGWSRDLVLITDGPSGLSADDRDQFARNGIKLQECKVARLEHDAGQLQAIRFEDGSRLERQGLFFATPSKQRCGLAESMGCDFTDSGHVAAGGYEKTNVPGLFVAGDASRHAGLAIVAAAEGARAAFGINTELLEEDRA